MPAFARFAQMAERTVRTRTRLLGPAMLVGFVAGLGAIVFLIASQAVSHFTLDRWVGLHPPPLAGEASFAWLGAHGAVFRPWLLLVVPTIGGLATGLLVFTLAPEAEGHGTDAAIESYHLHDGYIRPRVPIVKMIASAITIGTGGSGGREGPIAQIGAGFGSILAGLLRLPASDRRVLMSAGVGAGIAAIFKSPLAGALFASEVLYSSPEFEPEVIIPAGVASVVSYCVAGAFAGYRPLFVMPTLVFDNAWQLGPYLLLAIFVTLLAMIYTRSFYWTTKAFRSMRIPPHVRPAIGAFASGAVALALFVLFRRQTSVLAVLSYGYDALQDALNEGATGTAAILLAVALGKIATTSLTIGSGGSGGVFGPSMVIGGCSGGALGMVLHRYLPSLVPHPAAFVIVGMGGFFAAAAKTPFSTLIIVSEMTGGYGLLLPALWVCALSFILSDRMSIYGSQMESRGRSPAHHRELVEQLLGGVSVGTLLTAETAAEHSVEAAEGIAPIHASDGIDVALRSFAKQGTDVLPVADDKGKILGVLRRAEVTAAYVRLLEGEAGAPRGPQVIPVPPTSTPADGHDSVASDPKKDRVR